MKVPALQECTVSRPIPTRVVQVYIYFEGKQLLKTKLPKSWQGEPCEKVIEVNHQLHASRLPPSLALTGLLVALQLFADYYDKKNPGGELQRHLLQLTELKR